MLDSSSETLKVIKKSFNFELNYIISCCYCLVRKLAKTLIFSEPFDITLYSRLDGALILKEILVQSKPFPKISKRQVPFSHCLEIFLQYHQSQN